MVTEKEIKNDLKDIKFYYENYEVFCNATDLVGANKVVRTAEKYNEAMTYAPPRLYKLYLYLYCRRSSLKSVAYDLNYSVIYIEKLNKQLLNYLYQYFTTNGESNVSPFLNK